MNRPQIVLHIGTHKTGTSALQAALDGSREHLLQRGVLYPDTRRPPWPELPKHCSVYQAAAHGSADEQARERDALLSEWQASRAHTLLISEEGLSEPDEKIPEFFAPWAAQHDLVVICLLRRQDLFVEALFNQFVREAARREPRPLLTFARGQATRARLDYHGLLSRWAAIGARVVAIDFDGAQVRENGLMTTFDAALAHATGRELLALPERRANSSPDMRLALLLNRLNRQRIAYELAPLLQATRGLMHQGLPPLRHLLGRDERRRLLADVGASNERLAADFGISFSRELPQEPSCATEDLDPGFTLQLLASLTHSPSRPSVPS
ncbi:hypothetical protein AACH06_17935 [Ideonella sp. DXS29W]|uniref:Sulfotransferase family protein n=1 Tax=Ideonella lacteola TaxID=2984193 RepID=A0ABU9BSJ6_9BURK